MSTSSHRQALAHLRRADPVIARVIDAVGPCRFQARAEGTHFDALVRAIVYQQLSGKAAATIHGRLRALFGGRDPTPDELLAIPEETLRGVGLSRQKLGYIRDLAARVSSGELPIDNLHELDDDALTEALVRVKGIGRWTAQMFLMFRLGRPNVLPEFDLGIQNGMQRAYGLRARPKPKDVLRIGERWAPHASIASWYLWRVLEVPAWESATKKKRGTRDATTGSGTTKKRAIAKGRATAKRGGATAKRGATAKGRATTKKRVTSR
jgi:3-methyladenine DNA glycosylase/8-oxoguanine DNA glycosylase